MSKKISQLTAASGANITDAALFEMTDALTNSVKATIAQVRTAILTVTASLSIVAGAVTITAGLGLGAVATNLAFGVSALAANTSGAQNVAFGRSGLAANQSGNNNTALGYLALRFITASDSNTAVGENALASATSGDYNTVVGSGAMFSNISGSRNVAVGKDAGYNATGLGNVFLGYFAGKYETGAASFYVDAIDRTNTAGDKAGALLYGTFNATAASQTLAINAAVTTLGRTTGAGFTSSAGDIINAATAAFTWTGRSVIDSPANGSVRLTNNAVTGFTRLNFGLATTSFGAIGVLASGVGLQATLGDGTAAGVNFAVGGANATNATAGFFFINTSAGTPTGVPGNIPAGTVAMQYDTTGNKLWAYNGAWRSVTLA